MDGLVQMHLSKQQILQKAEVRSRLIQGVNTVKVLQYEFIKVKGEPEYCIHLVLSCRQGRYLQIANSSFLVVLNDLKMKFRNTDFLCLHT